MKQCNINVVYDRKKNASNIKPGLIQIDCTKNGQRFLFSTGLKVTKPFWKGKDHQWVSNLHENAIKYNEIINELLQKLKKYDLEQYAKGNDYPVESLSRVLEAKPVGNFLDYFDTTFIRIIPGLRILPKSIISLPSII